MNRLLTILARWRQCASVALPLNEGFLGPCESPHPKQHLGRFTHSCRVHWCAVVCHTNAQTCRPCGLDMCTYRPHLGGECDVA